MREVYRRTLELLFGMIAGIDLAKTWVAEWVAILRKRRLYMDLSYTSEENQRIDDFWRSNYGKRISKRWHRLYQSINGVYNECYFPEILFTTKLEPRLNAPHFARLLGDKSLTELLYDRVEGVSFPKTIAVNCSGYYYDETRNVTTEERVIKRIATEDGFVIKPTLGGSSGKGVMLVTLSGRSRHEREAVVREVLAQYRKNYIVQEKIRPHKSYERLYPYSINTIRLITYIVEGTVFCAPLILRMGCGGNTVDNIHAGGLCVGVSEEGVLKKYGYQLGYGDSKKRHLCHPDTEVVFENYHIPGVEEIIAAGKRLHGCTPHLGIVSWDLTVDESGGVVLIEGNYAGQSVWFPQIANEEPLFGGHTEYFAQVAGGRIKATGK